MKATIIPCNTMHVEIDGKLIPGVFKIESQWEGFTKLVCECPRNTLIVYNPLTPTNLAERIFGGGKESINKAESIEADIAISSIVYADQQPASNQA